MKPSRRDFIWSGSAFAALTASDGRAVAAPSHRVGVLMSYRDSDADARKWVEELKSEFFRLRSHRDEEIVFDIRWSGFEAAALHQDAASLVSLKPDVLVAGATPATIALRDITDSIPVVFTNVADPVGQGIVTNLSRPERNLTGFGAFDFALGGKWVELLCQMIPNIRRLRVLYNPETAPFYKAFVPATQIAAEKLHVQVHLDQVVRMADLLSVISEIDNDNNQGIIFYPGAFFTINRSKIISSIANAKIPAIYPYGFFAKDGGLVSYGFEVNTMFRQAASYVDRVLRGELIRTLPVQLPTRIELIVNTRAAKQLKIEIPTVVIARADEIIE